MNHLFAAVTALCILSGAGAHVASSQPDASRIWRKSVESGEKVPFSARMTLLIWQDDRTIATQGRLSQAAPNRFRLEYDTPPRAHGRIVWSDGHEQWQYEPRRKLMTRRPISPALDGARATSLRLVTRNYRFRLVSIKEKMASRSAYLIEVLPRYAGKSRMTVWIDRKTFKVLRSETRYPDGTVAKVVSYQQITIPAVIADTLLKPIVPPGTRVVALGGSSGTVPPSERAAHATSLRLDDEGPAGFVLQQVVESGPASRRTTQFIYSDGLETLSIFVKANTKAPKSIPANWHRVSIDGLPAFQSTTAHANYLMWHRWGRRYTAVSHLDRDALVVFARHQIAEFASAKPAK
jgi:outer membrane lipoprotein-sorting protein